MDVEFEKKLNRICSEFIFELENNVSGTLSGSCYLIGHCLSVGLSKSGFNTTETTGVLVLQDKNKKSIVYGGSKYKGKIVGNYHTWCVLDYGGKIIIDPSLKYNKLFLKNEMNIKLNERIPDCLISDENHTWYYNYIEDSSLIPKSKSYLVKVNQELINQLINQVYELSNKLFNK